MIIWVYIVECSDRSFYVGTARGGLELRIAAHNAGTFDGYTARRRPVVLRFAQEFAHAEDAIARERQIKGWSRAKKLALIEGNFDALPTLAKSKDI
jgi:predicted GIY-YIG superfamily endonuclease